MQSALLGFWYISNVISLLATIGTWRTTQAWNKPLKKLFVLDVVDKDWSMEFQINSAFFWKSSLKHKNMRVLLDCFSKWLKNNVTFVICFFNRLPKNYVTMIDIQSKLIFTASKLCKQDQFLQPLSVMLGFWPIDVKWL